MSEDPFDGNRPDPNTGSYNLAITCLQDWEDPEGIADYEDDDGKPYVPVEHLCLRLKGHMGEHRCGCQATFFEAEEP